MENDTDFVKFWNNVFYKPICWIKKMRLALKKGGLYDAYSLER